ncbi:unnamed protein product [Dibothriocephalus latus]|uniref:Uncharacterized protein n=1 Tax=Dibothriocephalus latus TaxID=60516 RepID=A0A3P7NAC2_DIBLA|nr:unnamed protein product [Dibothriocephalus latus]
MEKLDQLAKRFSNRAGLLDDWLNSTEKLMEDLLNHPGTQAGAAKKADALAAEVESKAGYPTRCPRTLVCVLSPFYFLLKFCIK